MSWSFSATGKASAVKAAMARTLNTYGTGTSSRAEFEEAKPSLDALLDQYVGDNVLVDCRASGSASFNGTEKIGGIVTVEIKPIYISAP